MNKKELDKINELVKRLDKLKDIAGGDANTNYKIEIARHKEDMLCRPCPECNVFLEVYMIKPFIEDLCNKIEKELNELGYESNREN